MMLKITEPIRLPMPRFGAFTFTTDAIDVQASGNEVMAASTKMPISPSESLPAFTIRSAVSESL